ncbi:MAG: DUF6443 domain-containing protein, partial [Chitinophagaceae bacterium]
MGNKYILGLLSLSIVCCFLAEVTQAQTGNKPKPNQTQVEGVPNAPGLRSAYEVKGSLNYVKTRTGVKGIEDEVEFDGKDFHGVKQVTQFLDGLGRPLQTVGRQAGPGTSPRDMVAPVVYDEFGREAVKYLPYMQSRSNISDGDFKADPFNDQANFYSSVYKDANQHLMYGGEQYLFDSTAFEASPLNRVSKAMAPGNSWT